MWIAPWGWTWIGDEPFGFAPFHYGRWAFVGGYWAWVPGPLVVRPVYAPALVAFVGGSGFGVTVGFGEGLTGVAWFPLGPRDVWVPGYHCSPRYVQNVNVTNTRVVTVTQVTNVYNDYTVNRTVNANEYTYVRNVSALTVVDRETFVNARPVSKATIRVTPEQFERARVVENVPLAPRRNSYVASTAKPVPVSRRPATAFSDRKVVAKLPPPIPASGGHEPRIVDSPKAERSAEPSSRNQQNSAERNSDVRENTSRGEVRTSNTAQAPAWTTDNSAGRENPSAQGEQEQRQYEQRPGVKFAPPARATDDKYDVHPPLNNREPEPPKKEESRKEQPPTKEEKRESPKSK